MSKQQLEHCVDCDNPTGRAGESDDSLRCEKCETGPLCPDCYHDHEAGQSLDCLTRQLAAMTERAEKAEEACRAFVEAWDRCLQLEKTDVALRLARAVITEADAEPESEVNHA